MDSLPLNFIDEPVEVGFDTPPVLEKSPSCPSTFVWRGTQYRVVEMFGAQSLMLRGGFSVIYQSNGHAPNNREITNPPLPAHAQPTTRRTVPLATSVLGGSDPTVKLDINTDGTLKLYNIGPDNQPSWISLDGVNVSL